MKIKITPSTQSSISKVDFNNIPFGKICSDHMFSMEYSDGIWKNAEIKPLENLSIHPANLAWHYGQSIFEGMKAFKTLDGTPLLFRPEKHIERLNKSADRMCMPRFSEELFLEAVEKLVYLEKSWIPSTPGSSLYLRPLMFATDEALGVRASDNYKFLIFCLPVGPYYNKPISLLVEEKYVRAVEGGVGFAKTAGNYAASLYPAKKAKEAGYDQVMWMDAKEFKYVQEVGTMNIFFVIDGEVHTPSTDRGTILEGITRETVMQVLQEKGYKVNARRIAIEEIKEAYKEGKLQEIFGTGTAAVIAPVNKLAYRDFEMELDPETYKVAPIFERSHYRFKKWHD